MLKSTIENLKNSNSDFASEYQKKSIGLSAKNRRESTEAHRKLAENELLIKKFEEKCLKSMSKQAGVFMPAVHNRMRRVNQMGVPNFLSANFILGIFSGLIITCTIMILIPKNKIPQSEISNNLGQLRNKYLKKAEQWSTDEIQEWLYQLGPWTNEFANIAFNLNMGNIIISKNSKAKQININFQGKNLNNSIHPNDLNLLFDL